MRVFFLICAFFCAAIAGLAQTTVIAFSNLEGVRVPYSGIEGSEVGFGIEAASSFTTDNTIGDLVSVTVDMNLAHSYPKTEPMGAFHLELYGDTNGLPGADLGVSFSGTNSYPTNVGFYTFTNLSHFTFATNTTYWLVAYASPDNVYYTWGFSTNATYSTNGWSMNYDSAVYTGGNWYSGGDGAYQPFNVVVANLTPLPLSISQPIVVTYPTPAFNFVLQQNSDMRTTNWIDVTNATLSVQISNQTFYILPPGSPQLFYRLSRELP